MDNLGAKLLSNVDSCFRKDPEIDEYDFVGAFQSKGNHNPVVLVDHKLGVEVWAVKVLVEYVYSQIAAWMVASRKQIQPSKATQLCSWTRVALLVVADFTTAWNIRKELVEQKWLTWEQECCFTNLILTKHPKSNETFAQKKWLILNRKSIDVQDSRKQVSHKMASSSGSSLAAGETSAKPHKIPGHVEDSVHMLSECSLNLLHSEVDSCRHAAERYPNNYNAWSHRIWLVQHVGHCQLHVVEEELSKSEGFVTSHVSDHSGWHYRQFLLGCMRSCRQHADLLQAELDLNTDLITRYHGHEALWYHRRYMLQQIVTMDTDQSSHMLWKKRRQEADSSSDQVQLDLVWTDTIISMQTGSWQATLADHHRRWLRRQFPA